MRPGGHPAQAELRLQQRSPGRRVTQFPGGFGSPNLPPGTGDTGKGESFPLGCSSRRAEPPSLHHGAEINYFPTKTMLLFAFPPPCLFGAGSIGDQGWHAQL